MGGGFLDVRQAVRQGLAFLIYNGADDKNIYSSGWVLFDKNDPTKVLVRPQESIFSPGPKLVF
jgi:predicted GH43/DUF377 family glycosyl hydrolase